MMWWPFRVKWVVLWSLWLAQLVRQPTLEVRVSNGWVRGTFASAGTHAQYLGIPYATVTRRFQEPGPEPKWDGVFEAVNENIYCTQRVNSLVFGVEQCLVLNVYTPLNPTRSGLAVLVFIHGGGFKEGTGGNIQYGGGYLPQKDVILVTINYRLNVLGFMCLGIKEAPGNAGLKDQVAALKWVKKNIRAFGGDPDNITLFGESAGAASVSYHMLSPNSKNLFHKAILQSGSSLSPWALDHDPVKSARRLAKSLGHDTRDPQELYNIFMSLEERELAGAIIPKEEGDDGLSFIIFSPCIETVNYENPFLNATPYDLFKKNSYTKVPMIVGSNTIEGLFFVGLEFHDLKLLAQKPLPKNIYVPSKPALEEVFIKLNETYFSGRDIYYDRYTAIAKYYSDAYFTHSLIEEAELRSRSSNKPVYFYYFSYCGWYNFARLIMPHEVKWIQGATHADELGYLFNPLYLPNLFEFTMRDRMTTLWTNFAKYGDPTPETTELLPVKWTAFDPLDPRALTIDRELATAPLKDLYPKEQFWKEVYEKYRRKA